MNQSHFLWHIDQRPEGCRHRPRRCLLKGCERLYWPRHWRSHYCSAACREAAGRWRRWQASQRYRSTESGKERRREQSRRYRQRVRERSAASVVASADGDSAREGQRLAVGSEDLVARPCARPGCYELFVVSQEHSCQRFCSVGCRRALRRVLDREARYRARRRRLRPEREMRQARAADTS